MTIRPLLLAILSFAAAIPCSAQTASSDAQTLQSILTELRAIREEVKTTQTTQILLTELEMQQSVVNRATQQVADIEAKLTKRKPDRNSRRTNLRAQRTSWTRPPTLRNRKASPTASTT